MRSDCLAFCVPRMVEREREEGVGRRSSYVMIDDIAKTRTEYMIGGI